MSARRVVLSGALVLLTGCGLEGLEEPTDNNCTSESCSPQTSQNNNDANKVNGTSVFFNNQGNPNNQGNTTSANQGAPNQGTPNQGTPNSSVPDDACALGALECVDGERYRECKDNGEGGSFWNTPAFCDYGACSQAADRCCDEPCPGVGQKRCVSGKVQECVQVDGCTTWGEPTSCLEDQLCSGAGECASPTQCTSTCSPAETRCLMEGGPEYQECEEVSAGCYQFSASSKQCGSGKACQGGDCISTCTDQCTSEGSTRCSGSIEQTCQRGASTCLDWANTGSCAPKETCYSNSLGGVDVPHGTCVQNADTNTFKTCPDGSTGCLWAFCNDGEWQYQCNRGNAGLCSGNLQHPHNTCG